VINNKFAFPASVLNQMIEEKVTSFAGVPSTYAYLLHRSPLVKYRNKLDSLRYCSQAGGHMSQQIKDGLRRALPKHADIYIMYGATEAGARLTYLEPDMLKRKIDSIGKAIPNVSIKIMDENDKELSAMQKGEVVASGANIMIGYWNDKVSTDKVLNYNGYHTGDLGYQDEDGYFYVKGRKDNLLKVGGHRVNPQEIEDAIMTTDLVVETAVVGKIDELLGTKLISVAVSKNGSITANDILNKCARLLPKFKLPSQIIIVRSLPKNANGKIDRGKCLEMVSN